MRFFAVCLAVLVASTAHADVNCSRSQLQFAVNAYLAAQTAGDRAMLPAAPVTRCYQQQEPVAAHDSVGFVRFGPNVIPDTHLFRLENARIRYVHTLTVCPDSGCAFN